MINHDQNRKLLIRIQIWAGITVVLGMIWFLEIIKILKDSGVSLLQSRWFVGLLYISPGSSLAGLTILLFTLTREGSLLNYRGWLNQPNRTLHWSSTAIVASISLIFGVLVLHPVSGKIVTHTFMPLVFYWWMLTFGTLALKSWRSNISWDKAFVISAIIPIIGYQLLSFVPRISSYPFSLGWSEASYFYYASLVASNKLYGMQLPISTMYPTRHLLDSLPFLIGISSIWANRFWMVTLSVGITLTTSLALGHRLQIPGRVRKWLFLGLVFVYLLQSDVKYELQVCVIIVLLGTSRHHPWRTFLSLLFASFWAGMSRLNWYPVPGMLVATLYFLEEPLQKGKSVFRYIWLPLFYFVFGIAVAFGGSVFTTLLTKSVAWGLDFGFGTGITSLWYRLLPNPTYPPGIILGIVLFSLPLWWILISNLFNKPLSSSWHFIRWIGLGTSILILLVGGLYVSTKIGGGGDLHNLDAYLVVTLVVASYIMFGRFTSDIPVAPPKHLFRVAIILAIPLLLYYVLSDLQPIFRYDRKIADQQIETIRSSVNKAALQGEVLFIRERQLLTFGYIKDILLVPEYELVELQTRANLKDPVYLDRFYRDLRNHRFSMIVSPFLNDGLQGSSYAWGEENDNWVIQVVQPLLCEYEPVTDQTVDMITGMNITFYVPRNQTDCP